MTILTTTVLHLRNALSALLRLLSMQASAMPPPNPPPERAWVFVNPLKPPK